MSDLKPRKAEIEIGGQIYHLAFTLNVLDAIIDRFGGLQEMIAEINPEGKTTQENNNNFVWMLLQMVNDDIEGRIDDGETIKPFTMRGLKRALSLDQIPVVRDAVVTALRESLPRREEEPKN